MTMSQIEHRLTKLEGLVETLADRLDYQQAVDGIRAGLHSADQGRGRTLKEAFKSIRAKNARARKSRR